MSLPADLQQLLAGWHAEGRQLARRADRALSRQAVYEAAQTAGYVAGLRRAACDLAAVLMATAATQAVDRAEPPLGVSDIAEVTPVDADDQLNGQFA